MTAVERDHDDQLRVLGLRQDVVGHATLRLAGGMMLLVRSGVNYILR
jgi:hypothetical protein